MVSVIKNKNCCLKPVVIIIVITMMHIVVESMLERNRSAPMDSYC